MELSPKQQIVELIKSKQKILLMTHQSPDGDAIGAILAFSEALKKMGKDVMAVCHDVVPEAFNYMPKISEVSQNLASSRDFVISLDTKTVKAERIMYKNNDGKLDITITPIGGQFSKEMVSAAESGFHFEVIVVLDCTDLERIGLPYESNAELFYEVPVINIDHHAGNDNFGKINLVDLTATSTSEILVSLIEALSGDAKFIDEEMATALLTGIITDTNSFQNTNTTPKSLTVAAQLVASGGHQQEIIKQIYKTKPLSTLRLWGRALSQLHDESNFRFVWTTLYKKDYLECGAAEPESSGVIDELLKTASGVEFALLLSEKNGDVHGSLRSTVRTKDVAQIAKLFEGGGHSMAAAFQIKNTTLEQSANMIIQKIKDFQGNQNPTIDN